MTPLSHSKSRSHAAFHGCLDRSDWSCSAIAASCSRMNASWIGIGFSHHNVPSLSNVATRSSFGTKSGPSSVTLAT